MGKCQSKNLFEPHQSQEKTIELEKTLQLYLNEKDDYKEKYESFKGKYLQIKPQLAKALTTVKDLQRKLTLSEENASSLYLRYAIETDLNRRIRLAQNKLKGENETLQKENERLKKKFGRTSKESELKVEEHIDTSRDSTTCCTNFEILERLHSFEQRICLIECMLKNE